MLVELPDPATLLAKDRTLFAPRARVSLGPVRFPHHPPFPIATKTTVCSTAPHKSTHTTVMLFVVHI